MTNGTSQGLFIVVGIIIFGIFVLISYILFKDTLKPTLSGIFTDSLEQSQDNLIGNIAEGVTFLGYSAFTNKNLVQIYYLPNTLSRYDATTSNHNMENTFVIGQYIEIPTKYGEGLYIEQFGNNFKIIRQ